jgi:uncharacterized protein HemX
VRTSASEGEGDSNAADFGELQEAQMRDQALVERLDQRIAAERIELAKADKERRSLQAEIEEVQVDILESRTQWRRNWGRVEREIELLGNGSN